MRGTVTFAVVLACICASVHCSVPGAAPSSLRSQATPSTTSPHWQPVVNVREVNAFNLLDRNSVFGAALRLECTALQPLNGDFLPYGCPNLGVVETDSVAIGDTAQEADLVATVVATSGLPAAVMAYFEIGANFNLTAANCTRAACKEVTQNLVKRNFKNVLSITASAYASTVAFQSVIEFEDADGDGQYDPSKDKMVSVYDFLTPAGTEQPLWGPMNLLHRQLDNGISEYVLNVTTHDGVFSVEYVVTDSDDDPSTSRTKINVQIKDYPYQSETRTSRLALLTYLGAARAGASVTSDPSIETTGDAQVTLTSGGLSGYFGWVQEATATLASGLTRTVAVKSTDWVKIGTVEEEALLTSISSIALAGNPIGTDGPAMLSSYFSFDVESPDYLYWDPELVFGGVTDPIGDDAGFAVVFVTVGGCFAVLVFGLAMAFLYRRRKVSQLEFSPLTKQLKDPVQYQHEHLVCLDDDARSDDTYMSPLTTEGSIYVPAEQIASYGSKVRAAGALVTCQQCKYTGVFGEGFCGNCGTLLPEC